MYVPIAQATLYNMEPILRESPNLYEYWMLVVFGFVFLILAYMRVAYSRRLTRLFSGLARLQILRQVMREELVFSHRASVLLFLNFTLVISIIIYAALVYYGNRVEIYPGWQVFGVIAITILLLYLGKLALGGIMRRLFNDPGVIREYLFEVFLVNKAAGFVLLPLAVGAIFLNTSRLPALFVTTVIIVACIFIFRLVQGLRISFSYPLPRIYIILYLCTLEILPFVLFFEAITRLEG